MPNSCFQNLFLVTCKETSDLELLPASSLSVILGLHDRRKAVEAQRWHVTFVRYLIILLLVVLFVCLSNTLIVLPRKLVRVNKIIVHQNFSTHSHDIALLKLGKFLQIFLMWIKVDCRRTRGPFQVSSSVSSTNWRGLSTQHYGLCVWWVCPASHDYLILLIIQI